MNLNLRVAAIQLNATPDKTINLANAKRLTVQAIEKGARFIVLPEAFNFRGSKELIPANAEPIPGPSTKLFQDLARDYNVSILLGSIVQSIPGQDKVFNTSVMINGDGTIVAQYNKIHLFDVDVDHKQFRESDTFGRGTQPVIATVLDVPVGISICYDLRFPELYRHYSSYGAKMVCVPSSFTTHTGQAHWETLVRARAIENLMYVIAPNQYGVGTGGVATYGNSLIVDPWGHVLARGDDHAEQVLVADIDFYGQQVLRNQFPCLNHRIDIR
ncbi:carbon-nitrogen hydrolase family protein [bacterium]|nr:carbon-nitrogen hydrolase family protein [bacterium]